MQAISENTFFKPNEFIITESDVNKSTYGRSGPTDLIITYFDNEAYEFRVSLPKGKDKDGNFEFDGMVRPGEYAHEQDLCLKGGAQLMTEIKSWVQRIEQDIRSNPLGRRLAEQQARIDDLLKQFSSVPSGNEYFTREEAEDMRKRLDKLEGQLVEQLKKASLDDKAEQQKISEVDNDIGVLKAQLEQVPKKSWFKRLAVRLGIWAADPTNQQLLQAGGAVVKGLLGAGHPGGAEVAPPGK